MSDNTHSRNVAAQLRIAEREQALDEETRARAGERAAELEEVGDDE